MAYFQRRSGEEAGYTRQFAPRGNGQRDPREDGYGEDAYDDGFDDETYDDGFDELLDPEDPEAEDFDPRSEEERREDRRRKFRIAAGFGDFGAILAGVVVILALLAFLISMIRFVSTDFSETFSFWQTKI